MGGEKDRLEEGEQGQLVQLVVLGWIGQLEQLAQLLLKYVGHRQSEQPFQLLQQQLQLHEHPLDGGDDEGEMVLGGVGVA